MGRGFDTVFASDLPALHPRLGIAARFVVPPGEDPHGHEIDVRIEGPDGTVLARAAGPLEGPAEAQFPRATGQPLGIAALLDLQTIVFRAYGEHRVVVRWDDDREHVVRFFVVATPEADR